MPEKKVLLAYYSRTGMTAKVARDISASLGCEIEEIRDKKDRSGLFNLLASGRDVFLRELTEIEECRHNPSDYDITIIGTPIWMMRMSLPIKAYVLKHRKEFGKVAFLCTGSYGSKHVFRDMEYHSHAKPISTLGVSRHDSETSYSKKLKKFLNELERAAGR